MAWFHRQRPTPRAGEPQQSEAPPRHPELVESAPAPRAVLYIPPPLSLLDSGADDGVWRLRDLLQTAEYNAVPSPLTVALGLTADAPCIVDLTVAEHCLVAGAPPVIRDSMVHTILLSLLLRSSPDVVRILLLEGDTTAAPLPIYGPIPHLVSPVVTETPKIVGALRWAVQELERRQRLFGTAGADSLHAYNDSAAEKLSFILIVLNEFVPVIRQVPDPNKSDFTSSVSTLLQDGARHGIHMLITTQLPETTTLVDLFPALLKHRMPAKVLWAGPWLTNNGAQPWLLQTAFDHQTRTIQGVWVSPRDAAHVADYFAPPGTVTPGTVADLDALSGIEFEETMQAILRDRGWQLDLTAVTGDFGADLIGRGPDGATWVIQAKRWKGSVGIEAVQQVLGAQAYYHSQKALLVTTAPLTKAAAELAEQTHVAVWARDDIVSMFADFRTQRMGSWYSAPFSKARVASLSEENFAVPEEDPLDPLFWDAVGVVLESGQASTSMLQRRMRLGYTRSAALIDTMELHGYIGPADGAHPRTVFLTREQLQQLMEKGP